MSALVDARQALRRLKTLARSQGVVPQQLLTRFALERFLYRLSMWERRCALMRPPGQRHRPEFIVKGAWCFVAWHGDLYRPTKDLDLHRVGDASEARLRAIVCAICGIEGADDVIFDPRSVASEPILQGHRYGGTRLAIRGTLGAKTRLSVNLDIVPGDDVFEPERQRLTTLVPPLPEPEIAVYSRESVVAEKLETIAATGMLNSRMKDYLDLYKLSMDERGFRAADLSNAIRRTFARRRSHMLQVELDGLSVAFAERATGMWKYGDPSLLEAVERIRLFVGPILAYLSGGSPLPTIWRPQDGWRPT